MESGAVDGILCTTLVSENACPFIYPPLNTVAWNAYWVLFIKFFMVADDVVVLTDFICVWPTTR